MCQEALGSSTIWYSNYKCALIHVFILSLMKILFIANVDIYFPNYCTNHIILTKFAPKIYFGPKYKHNELITSLLFQVG